MDFVPFAHVFAPMNMLGDAVCQMFAIVARLGGAGFRNLEKRLLSRRG